ncbi:MAG: tRNA (uridine(34)/cytosine(34)/5-carboxymethylaminomethyluridine(34)-2'-O)-methyltransferase TrmL [Candidatus Melainabacteria bacterium RIFOXYA2_FULL_32_9]|nr:MAG: tRNA (uridine(34)/cytosine(34)/5-carboxymethylaminomethyluridine(34)-2'-O)-methyltransferase TrmL [Candidatus Melainabacteria bacterium RIFOXYA2_FULL_32_9]
MHKESFRIVLIEPEIPQNTGNIARLCACTGCELYLVGKLGFLITDKHLKRAGLDYWDEVKIEQYNNLEELKEKFPDNNFYYLTTKAEKLYTEMQFKPGDFLVFGSETKGLPKELIEENINNSLKIPMKIERRSLNLSNCASIVLYEAIRQTNYFDNN